MFHIASYYTFRDMNYFLPFLVQYGVQSTEYRVQTESDAYEPTVQVAQVGSKKGLAMCFTWPFPVTLLRV